MAAAGVRLVAASSSRGPSGIREFIKVLGLLQRHSLRDLSIAVERPAVMLSVNADVIDLPVCTKNETPVKLFSPDGHAHLPVCVSKRSTSLRIAP